MAAMILTFVLVLLKFTESNSQCILPTGNESRYIDCVVGFSDGGSRLHYSFVGLLSLSNEETNTQKTLTCKKPNIEWPSIITLVCIAVVCSLLSLLIFHLRLEILKSICLLNCFRKRKTAKLDDKSHVKIELGRFFKAPVKKGSVKKTQDGDSDDSDDSDAYIQPEYNDDVVDLKFDNLDVDDSSNKSNAGKDSSDEDKPDKPDKDKPDKDKPDKPKPSKDNLDDISLDDPHEDKDLKKELKTSQLKPMPPPKPPKKRSFLQRSILRKTSDKPVPAARPMQNNKKNVKRLPTRPRTVLDRKPSVKPKGQWMYSKAAEECENEF